MNKLFVGFLALLILLSAGGVARAEVADDYGTGTTANNYCPKLSTTFQRGARDTTTAGQVTELQKFIADYYDVDPEEIVSGFYGRITQGYVVKFQKEQGLPAFGIVGSLSRAAIAKACGGSITQVPISCPQISIPHCSGSAVSLGTDARGCKLGYQCLTVSNSDAVLVASPTSGPAPLTVYFKGSGSVLAPSAGIRFGDGAMTGEGVLSTSHTYTSPGTYYATLLKDGAKGEEVARVTITVTSPSVTLNKSTCKYSSNTLGEIGKLIIPQSLFTDGDTCKSQCILGRNEKIGRQDSGICEWDSGNGTGRVTYQIPAEGLNSTIRVTSPNGGEVWTAGTLNTVTWAPYGYSPATINGSNEVDVYLYDLNGNNLGKLLDTGKASLHTYLNIGDYSTFVKPGSYYVYAKNRYTGASDKSDAPFTVLARPLDIKVNGSNGPITLYDNQPVTVTFETTKTFDSCIMYGVRNAPSGSQGLGISVTQPYSGYAYAPNPNFVTNVYVTCVQGSNTYSDSVTVNQVAGAVQPTLRIVTPNGGEMMPMTSPNSILWTQKGLSKVSIALYKNDMWYAWLAKDLALDKSANDVYSYSWNNLSNPVISDGDLVKPIFKIYITGTRADGQGYVDDKSDAPFSVGNGTLPPPVTLKDTQVVGVYEGTYPAGVTHSFNSHPEGTVNVTVGQSYNGKPAHLVLTSYEPVNWVISNPSGTPIEKVLVLSYHDSRVTGLPANVPVEKKSLTSGGNFAWGCAYANYETNGGCSFNQLKNWLVTQGLDIESFVGSYTGNMFNVTIGGKG